MIEQQALLLDWAQAERHLAFVMGEYEKFIDTPGVNVGFALMSMTLAKDRFDRGERTADLHAEMMSFE